MSGRTLSMSDLYDTDILERSERQAELLRRVAAGERLNEQSPDWPNIIEEIESVGSEQFRSVESLLVLALLHILKKEAWPHSAAAPGWRAEARRFRGDAASRFSPSMRQRFDLARLYARAVRAMPETIHGHAPLPVTVNCATSLDELLDGA
jgi:hypothetical protein